MVNVDVKFNKDTYLKAYIQDHKNRNGQMETLQGVIQQEKNTSLTIRFDDIEEWRRFVDFFKITEIADHREVQDIVVTEKPK